MILEPGKANGAAAVTSEAGTSETAAPARRPSLGFWTLTSLVIGNVIGSSIFLLPSLHGVIAVYMKREDRKHREIVEAIERHGPLGHP